MEVRKVTYIKAPAYPDKSAVLDDPYLLKTLPERWKRNAAACASLATTSAMLMSACAYEPGETTPAPTVSASPSLSVTQAPTPSPSPTAKVLQSVPVFEHGVGRGTFGCISVNPPVFLSEAEALEAINEAAKLYGLDFGFGIALEDAGIPVITDDVRKAHDLKITFSDGTIKLDGYDESKKIAYEYISASDIEAWRAEKPRSSAQSYPFLDVSNALAEELGSTEKGMTVAVFYDPVTRMSESGEDSKDLTYEEAMGRIKERAKDDLRAQVRDFIAWLKAQDII